LVIFMQIYKRVENSKKVQKLKFCALF
jgi:hypothetical protein